MHRNLTPESVVLGPGGLVKLGEFGMAKLASFGVVTTADQQLAAVLYAAPEQLVGKAEVGPRADIYGLGVLLYEAIAGVRPMGRGPFNTMKAVSWHLHERALPLRERAAARGAPADLEALVHQMLEKNPSMRPASALEVYDRLRDVRVSLRAPLLREARNAAPVERPWPWRRRSRWPQCPVRDARPCCRRRAGPPEPARARPEPEIRERSLGLGLGLGREPCRCRRRPARCA